MVAEQHRRFVGERGVLEGAVDLGLAEGRIAFARPAARRQEMELMTRPAGPVPGARVAGVEPKGQAVGGARPLGISQRRDFLPDDGELYAEAEVVPRESQVGEARFPVEFREIGQAGRFGQF